MFKIFSTQIYLASLSSLIKLPRRMKKYNKIYEIYVYNIWGYKFSECNNGIPQFSYIF